MTEPFVPTARALAAALGVPDYPLCVIPHPISSDEEAVLGAKARAAAVQIADILTQTAR